jgi:hypothetical protein
MRPLPSLALMLFILCGVTLPGCKKKDSAASSDEIVVGEFASLTGATASFGQSTHKGVLMAVDDEEPLVFVEKRNTWIDKFINLREEYRKVKSI